MPVIEKFLCSSSRVSCKVHCMDKGTKLVGARRRIADPQTGASGVKSKVGLGRQERHLIRNTFTPRNVAKLRARPARACFLSCRRGAVSFVLVARNEGHDLQITRASLLSGACAYRASSTAFLRKEKNTRESQVAAFRGQVKKSRVMMTQMSRRG
jgi:hypothetical protein